MDPVHLEIESLRFTVELIDHGLARALVATLPAKLTLTRWGDEYYGDIGIDGALATTGDEPPAREIMEVGDVAFWPDGNALCLFFGPTPASTDDRPRAVSPVIPLGRIRESAERLARFGNVIPAGLSD